MPKSTASAPATTWRVRSVPDLLIAVGVILAGVAVIIYASTMQRLHTGEMGPGLFPTTVGVMMVFFGAILLFQTVRPRPESVDLVGPHDADGVTHDPDADDGNVSVVIESPKRLLLNAAAVALGVVAYIVLAEPLGFALTMALILLVIQKVLGASLRSAALVSLGLTLGLYLMFEKLLLVQLPDGPWGF